MGVFKRASFPQCTAGSLVQPFLPAHQLIPHLPFAAVSSLWRVSTAPWRSGEVRHDTSVSWWGMKVFIGIVQVSVCQLKKCGQIMM